MRKGIILLLSLALLSSSIFAHSDYDQGYLEGYEACKKGEINEVQIRLIEEAINQSNLGVWDLNYFIDDFGDQTSEGYISTPDYMYGVFYNSSTTKHDLSAYFLISNDTASIKLFEYENYQVNGSSAYPTEYQVSIKCDNEIYKFTATNYSDRIVFCDYESLINLLKIEKPIKICIKENSSYGYGTSYLLKDIETTGFNEAMHQLFNK